MSVNINVSELQKANADELKELTLQLEREVPQLAAHLEAGDALSVANGHLVNHYVGTPSLQAPRSSPAALSDEVQAYLKLIVRKVIQAGLSVKLAKELAVIRGKVWPLVSFAEARGILTAPGMPFEMETVDVRGVPMRVYKGAAANLRILFDFGRMWGDRDFVVYEGERLTFENHYRAATKLGHVLRDQFGIKKGDRVALAMRNYPEWTISYWATIAIGAVIVPINAWGTGPELEYCITDSGSKVLICDGERLERLKPHIGELKVAGIICARETRQPLSDAHAFERLVGEPKDYANLSAEPLPDPELHPDDNAWIFYTSGTTGKPKGALNTHRATTNHMLTMFYLTARVFVLGGEAPPAPDPMAPQFSSLLSVPLFHATGCNTIMMRSYAMGAKIVLMHKWNPERALELIETEKIMAFGGVPSMVWQVLESPDFDRRDTSSVEAISYGGAPSAPELVEQIKRRFPRALSAQGYGLTEVVAAACGINGEDYLRRPDSAGPAVPVLDFKVVDDKDAEVPVGQSGELCIKGVQVMKEYWNKPEATEKAIKDGWFHTGDLVRMDADGYIYVLDRAKDMLIRGGENIYCVEVEAALYAHPAVMDAAVVAIPHRVLGEEVGAVVQIAPGKHVTEEELQDFTRRLIAGFKVPVKIELRSEPLPRTASGKILKSTLRNDMKKYAREA